MTALHDRLTALADEAPTALPEPGLWDRGRRYQRVRRSGTAAIVVSACLAILVLGVTWLQATPPDRPGPADAQVGLPDRIWSPDPTPPGTDDAGPLGQLVAVIGTLDGVVGISAATGEYETLDLPGRALDIPGPTPADDELVGTATLWLSPDGTKVAYLLGGKPSDSGASDAVTGLAVQDTATGDVQRLPIDTEFGIVPDGVVWSTARNEQFVWLQYSQLVEPPRPDTSSATGEATIAWNLTTGKRSTMPYVSTGTLSSAGTGPDGFVVRRGDGLRLIRVPDDYGRPASRQQRPLGIPSFVDPSGTVVAGVKSQGSSDNDRQQPVFTAPFSQDGKGVHPVTEIPGVRAWEVVGWRDPGHLVVRQSTGERVVLRSVDVTTGAGTDLVELVPALNVRFATDLLAAPTYAASAPPHASDTWWRTGLLLAAVLAGAGGVVLWRRRVRP